MGSLEYVLGFLLGAKDLSLQKKKWIKEDKIYSVKINERTIYVMNYYCKTFYIIKIKSPLK